MRELWRLDPDVTFLNHGSFGACPIPVLETQARLRDAMEREPVDFLVACWDLLTETVAEPAKWLGGAASDLVFVDNATSGVNAVVRSLDLRPGDAILTTSHAYDAVRKTLRYVCGRAGASLIEVSVPFPIDGPDQVVAAVEAAADRHDRIRLAVLDHVTSKTGLVLPIDALCASLRARGIPVLVDAAHAPGQVPVHLESTGAEWWTGNLHKWAFAPKGCAVLHVRPEVQAITRPLTISHGYGEGLHREFHWVGTKDPTPWLCAPAAIQFHESLGGPALMASNRALADAAGDLLSRRWATPRPAPGGMCAAMVTLQPPGPLPGTEAAASALHEALRRRGFEVPCFAFDGRVWLRISAQAYNTLEEYERLGDAVAALSS